MTTPRPRRSCVHCGQRLAADNPGRQCGPCQRTQDQSAPPALPAGFWDAEQIQDALASWHMGRIIHAYRTHPHHRQPLTQELVAGWLGLTQAQLSRIENGRAPEELSKLIHYSRTLGIPADLLWFDRPGETRPRRSTTAEPRDESPAWPPPGTEGRQDRGVGHAGSLPPARSAAGRSTAPSERARAGDPVAWPVLEAGQRESVEERLSHVRDQPRSVDLVTIALLRQRVEDLDARYDRTPPAGLLPEAGQLLALVSYLRSQVPTARLHRELLTAEAEAAILTGQLVWDASQRRDHRQAHTYLDRAAAAGRELRNPIVEGLALLRSTIVALHGERDPRAALDFARRCIAVAEGSSAVIAGLATLHAAEAYALQRSTAECEELLGHAESLLGGTGAADEASYLYSPSHLPRMAGSCYLFLGQPKTAEDLLGRARSHHHSPAKADAIVLGNLALAQIRQRKPDEAGHAFDQALDVITRTWGGGGISTAFAISRELQPWRHVPAVRDACDRFLDVMAPRVQTADS